MENETFNEYTRKRKVLNEEIQKLDKEYKTKKKKECEKMVEKQIDEIIDIIIERREKIKMSRYELANLTGITYVSLSNIKKKKSRPNILNLCLICMVLGLNFKIEE